MSNIASQVMAQNGHPLVEALRPGGPVSYEFEGQSETRKVGKGDNEVLRGSKVLVRIDEGAYVDPLRVVCVRVIAVGSKGYVRVTLENGDDFDVRQHDCELNRPDTHQADQVIEQLMAGLNPRR